MAIKDFRRYLGTVYAQYTEAKNDLADFEQCLKNGLITEDRLSEVKEELSTIEQNYQRLVYVDYLLCRPNRYNKKNQFDRSTKKLAQVISAGSDQAVIEENKTALNRIKQELATIKTEIGS